MAKEGTQGSGPGCFVEACDELLFCEGGDDVRPTQGDMIKALQCEYTVNVEQGLAIATAPDGTVYMFDMKAEKHVTAIDKEAGPSTWLIYMTLQSLAGLEVESLGLGSLPQKYQRTLSDGTTTLQICSEAMFFKSRQ